MPAPPSIRDILPQGSLVLAPLAGYTDLPFRLICRESGAVCCFSEMVSCHGLNYTQANTLALLRSTEEERPFAVQLFGSEPEAMGRAASLIPPQKVDLIDINMGCPVRKVVKKGCGAALMRDMPRARAIIQAVRAATPLPVTVKFRSGWTEASINAPEFAAMAEEAGAAAVTVHGRTWSQGFGGRADWGIIRAVRAAVRIPVIGNGDVLSPAGSERMLMETGCHAVMIGRGALGNPWIFSRQERPSDLAGRLPVIERYLELAQRYLDSEKLLFKIKNHTAQFLGGLPGASRLRKALYGCADIASIRNLLLRDMELTHQDCANELPG